MRRARGGLGRTVVPALVAATLIAASCQSAGDLVDADRTRNRACADERTAAALVRSPRGWMVVQGGDVAAVAPSADDAVRGAALRAPHVRHRFVYRAEDPGDRLHRMAYMPEGGMVAGRRLLADLGLRVVGAGAPGGGRTVVLERRGTRRTIDLAARPRLRLDLQPLAGGPTTTIDVPFDPDFDGPLLLPEDLTHGLDLVRAEIPGTCQVQVALGRPFTARRAWCAARCADLDATGPVEVLVRMPPPAR